MSDHSLVIDGELHLLGPVGFRDFNGEGFTVRDVTEALAEMDGDITVRINSGGGAAFDGIAIHSLLSQYDGEVTTVAQGIAASAASVIFMAGEKRIMADGALLMIHDASGITFGTEVAHRKTADTLKKLSNSMAGIYAGRTTGNTEGARAVMLAETWFAAADAIKSGFATGGIDTGAEPVSAFDYTLYSHAPEFLVKMPGKSYEGADQIAASLVAATRKQPKEDHMAKAPVTKIESEVPAAKALTLASLKADHPEIVDALVAETGTDAAKGERERIKACLAVLGATSAGETVNALCFDGKSSPGDVALAVLAEAKTKGSDHLASLAAQETKMSKLKAAPVADFQDAPVAASTLDGWMAEFKVSEKIQREFLSAEDYAAFKAAESAGRVKVLHTNERTA